jgi:hypothetical protein
MAIRRKLRLALLRDAICFFLIVGFFVFPDPVGAIVFIIAVPALIMPLRRKISADGARLDSSEKHIYFGFTFVCVMILIGLILSWVSRHTVPAAGVICGLAMLVLFGLLYASYNDLFPRQPRV